MERRDAQRRYGDIRYKAWTAREKGAVGLIVVDARSRPKMRRRTGRRPTRRRSRRCRAESYGDAGIPVVMVKRSALGPLLADLEKKKKARAELKVSLTPTKQEAFNVVARLPAGVAESERLPGVVVLGAHYDHLGHGGARFAGARQARAACRRR